MALTKKALPVDFVAKSCNEKLGYVAYGAGGARPRRAAMRPFISCTFAPIWQTCPDCVFKGTPWRPGGCFALAGMMKFKLGRLHAAAAGMPADEIIEEEAGLIERSYAGRRIPQDGYLGRGRDLRLHVSGDVRSLRSAERLSRAAENYAARDGGSVFTFTHAWPSIPRRLWGGISVLASVETPRDVLFAVGQGYVPALTVPEFPNGAKPFAVAGIQFNPCPQQTMGVPCVSCRQCLDDSALRTLGRGIAFRAHGVSADAARTAIERARSSGRQPSGPRSGRGERGSRRR